MFYFIYLFIFNSTFRMCGIFPKTSKIELNMRCTAENVKYLEKKIMYNKCIKL